MSGADVLYEMGKDAGREEAIAEVIALLEPAQILAVDWQRVNLSDLIAWRPAGIILCMGNPHDVIRLVGPPAVQGREAVEGDI